MQNCLNFTFAEMSRSRSWPLKALNWPLKVVFAILGVLSVMCRTILSIPNMQNFMLFLIVIMRPAAIPGVLSNIQFCGFLLSKFRKSSKKWVTSNSIFSIFLVINLG